MYEIVSDFQKEFTIRYAACAHMHKSNRATFVFVLTSIIVDLFDYISNWVLHLEEITSIMLPICNIWHE